MESFGVLAARRTPHPTPLKRCIYNMRIYIYICIQILRALSDEMFDASSCTLSRAHVLKGILATIPFFETQGPHLIGTQGPHRIVTWILRVGMLIRRCAFAA